MKKNTKSSCKFIVFYSQSEITIIIINNACIFVVFYRAHKIEYSHFESIQFKIPEVITQKVIFMSSYKKMNEVHGFPYCFI